MFQKNWLINWSSFRNLWSLRKSLLPTFSTEVMGAGVCRVILMDLNVFKRLPTTSKNSEFPPGTELRLEPRRLLELQAIHLSCRISNLKYHPNNPIISDTWGEKTSNSTVLSEFHFLCFFTLLTLLHFFRFSLSRIFPLLRACFRLVRCVVRYLSHWKQTVLIRWGSARCRSVENMKP